MDLAETINLKNNLNKVRYELLNNARQLEIQINELTKKIEMLCKHNWVIDKTVYDPHQSHYVCTICNTGN